MEYAKTVLQILLMTGNHINVCHKINAFIYIITRIIMNVNNHILNIANILFRIKSINFNIIVLINVQLILYQVNKVV